MADEELLFMVIGEYLGFSLSSLAGKELLGGEILPLSFLTGAEDTVGGVSLVFSFFSASTFVSEESVKKKKESNRNKTTTATTINKLGTFYVKNSLAVATGVLDFFRLTSFISICFLA